MTIVYTSKTGHTRQYAEMLAKSSGLKAFPLEEAEGTLARGEEVLYMGWLMAGHISGLDRAVRRWSVKAVCGVGMSPASDSVLTAMASSNHAPNAAAFYLQGGWQPEKVGWFQRRMVNAVTRSIRTELQQKTRRTPEEQAYLDMLLKGGSFVAFQNLKPVQKWLETQG